MTDAGYSLILIAVMAGITILIRFLPFLVFHRGAPKAVLYLGEVLPYAIMAMLVVYCLKDCTPLSGNHAVPELLAVLLVVALHKWKHNTLLSIGAGTVFYMVMVQWVM